MKKRTKIIILTAMVLLLGVTGYLNIVLNNSIKQTSTTTEAASYFSSFRNDRASTRDQELLYYDAIINGESSTESAVAAAQQAKLDLIDLMDKELVVEGLIKAQGFEDCVVVVTDSKVNVVVKAAHLEEDEAIGIWTTVIEQLKRPIEDIIINYAE